MKKLTFLFLLTLLPLMASAQSQDNLVDRVSRAVGVRLPDGYEAKVKEFVASSKLLSRQKYSNPTELFIKNQMKSNWGVNKQNQLLFIWDAVYEQLKGKDKHIYTCEDGNEQRLNDLDKVMYKTEACGLEYTVECRISTGLQDLDTSIGKFASRYPTLTQETNTYKKKKEEYALREKSIKSKLPNYEQLGVTDMTSLKKEVKSLYDDVYDLIIKVAERRSAEADRQSAEYERQSAEADRQSAEYERQSAEASIEGVKEAVRFYKLYKNNPNTVLPGEIKKAKEYTVDFINGCKKYNIDYKAILRKELGDDKKVAELLKFYGIE